jgi:hypothetical protein
MIHETILAIVTMRKIAVSLANKSDSSFLVFIYLLIVLQSFYFSTTENGSAGIVTPPVPVIVSAMHREL